MQKFIKLFSKYALKFVLRLDYRKTLNLIIVEATRSTALQMFFNTVVVITMFMFTPNWNYVNRKTGKSERINGTVITN